MAHGTGWNQTDLKQTSWESYLAKGTTEPRLKTSVIIWNLTFNSPTFYKQEVD